MAEYFRVKLFNLTDEEITFESFIEFPLKVFSILLFDINPLSENATLKTRAKYYAKMFYNSVCLFNLVAATYQFAAYAVYHSDDFAVLASSLSYVLTTILVSAKMLVLFRRKSDIREIFEDLREISNCRVHSNRTYGVKGYLDAYLRIAKVFSAVSFTACLMVFFPPLLNFIVFGAMKPALYFWFPLDIFQMSTFPITLFWADYTAYNSSSFQSATDLTLYAMITVVAMEFDILKTDFMHLGSEAKFQEPQKLSNLAKRHNKLLEVSAKLQEIYEFAFLISFVISSIIICSVLFQVTTTQAGSANYAHLGPYLFTLVSQIGLLCFFGQKLKDSSVGVAEGIYACDWTSFDNDERKEIVLVMIRAQRQQTLTAMNFAEVSLESFKNVRNIC